MKIPPLGTLDLGDGVEYKLDLDRLMSSEYDDIGQAATELPAIIEWVNAQLQLVNESKIIKKHEIKELEAKAYFDAKNNNFFGGKKTETAVSHAVALDKDVIRAYREYAALSAWSQRLSNLLFSLQAKLDLVRSTEATRRRSLIEDSQEID